MHEFVYGSAEFYSLGSGKNYDYKAVPNQIRRS